MSSPSRPPTMRWMKLEPIIQSEVSQKDHSGFNPQRSSTLTVYVVPRLDYLSSVFSFLRLL